MRLFVCTCPGLVGVRGLAPPPRVDGHDAQPVVCVGLKLHHSAGRSAHHGLREEIPSLRLCPQDVAGRPGNLCELHSDAVAVFGVSLFNVGNFRSWRTHDRRQITLNDNKLNVLKSYFMITVFEKM